MAIVPMAMLLGTEWLVDASGCDPDSLRNLPLLRRLFERVIAELDLRVVGEALWHQFPSPGGITGLVLLSESHLTLHTYPEFGAATLNLHCCRNRAAWPWKERLAEALSAKEVTVRIVERTAIDWGTPS